MKNTIRGSYRIYAAGVQISGNNLTPYYDTDNKNPSAMQAVITRQAIKAARKIGGDSVDVFLHYSCLPAGPFLTRNIGIHEVMP